MNNSNHYKKHYLKGAKLLIGITLLQMNPSILNAGDFELASIANSSETFELPIFEDETTSFGAKIFDDINKNGVQDKNEIDSSGVKVKLIDKDGNEINVGPDGILGTGDDSPGGVVTDDKGMYFFYKITHKFYRIQIEVE